MIFFDILIGNKKGVIDIWKNYNKNILKVKLFIICRKLNKWKVLLKMFF